MKKILSVFMLIVCLVTFGGCINLNNKGDFVEVYRIAEEYGIKEDGKRVYKIVYNYDSEGNEISRTAYDDDGTENSQWLQYAYDKLEIPEEYWEIEVDKEDGSKIWKEEDGIWYMWDYFGRLESISGDSSVNPYGVETIKYTYRAIKVSKENTKEDNEAKKDNNNNTFENENKVSLEDKINDGMGTIIVSGEECNAIWGETGTFVWKYVEATFDEKSYYASAFAIDIADVSLSENVYEESDAIRITNWYKWYGFEEFPIKHIGDDIFELSGDYYGENYCYYINAINNNVINWIDYRDNVLDDEKDGVSRLTYFNDGYAIMGYTDVNYIDVLGYKKKETKNYLAVMDTQWNVKISEIETDGKYFSSIYSNNDPGIYSGGVFYWNYAFYDIYFNKILELDRNRVGQIYTEEGIYAPYFCDGICRLITLRNDKYWIFDIDKSGEIVSEIEEFDLSLLDI
ncbi:MAG: hypothetical protein E7266_00180 [Lachnospiraceae bacterium]|nr:hypothetical protein [Lachnospiraceae bacterium]